MGNRKAMMVNDGQSSSKAMKSGRPQKNWLGTECAGRESLLVCF